MVIINKSPWLWDSGNNWLLWTKVLGYETLITTSYYKTKVLGYETLVTTGYYKTKVLGYETLVTTGYYKQKYLVLRLL